MIKTKEKSKYIGKTGYIMLEGLKVAVKILDYKNFFSREHVLITPIAKKGEGESWKYLSKIEFDK